MNKDSTSHASQAKVHILSRLFLLLPSCVQASHKVSEVPIMGLMAHDWQAARTFESLSTYEAPTRVNPAPSLAQG